MPCASELIECSSAGVSADGLQSVATTELPPGLMQAAAALRSSRLRTTSPERAESSLQAAEERLRNAVIAAAAISPLAAAADASAAAGAACSAAGGNGGDDDTGEPPAWEERAATDLRWVMRVHSAACAASSHGPGVLRSFPFTAVEEAARAAVMRGFLAHSVLALEESALHRLEGFRGRFGTLLMGIAQGGGAAGHGGGDAAAAEERERLLEAIQALGRLGELKERGASLEESVWAPARARLPTAESSSGQQQRQEQQQQQ